MISNNKNVKQVFSCGKTINTTIPNILLILFYNVFKTLKWKYMLNQTTDETSETMFPL